MRTSMQFVAMAIVVAVSAVNSVADVIYINAAAPDGGDGMSWATAFNDLQDGLAAATPGSGDQLWVAAGIYTPTGPGGDRLISFNLVSTAGIYGGFNGTETTLEERDPAVNITILSGDLNGDDKGDALDPSHAENSYHVVYAINAAAGTLLDGLTITSGNANLSGTSVHGGAAGALIGSSVVAINNCTITTNACRRSGCGIGTDSALTITDSRIIENRGNPYAVGVGLFMVGGSLIMSNCDVSNNIGSLDLNPLANRAGGIFVQATSSTTIDNCVFEGNQSNRGGAIEADGGPGAISNCVFRNNTQAGGGALLMFAPMTVTDCQFIGNYAVEPGSLGGGLSVAAPNSTVPVTNCFFAGNTAEGSGGGAYSQSNSGSTFVNCVFTGNSATENGGALYTNGSIAGISVINCTLAGNTAGQLGGGIARVDGSLTVLNTIMWNNSDSAGDGEASQYNGLGGGSIRFSTVQGWTGGFGDGSNSGVDPLFVDADGPDNTIGTKDDNLRLDAASLCIDNGDPAAPAAHPTDIDGQPREIACIVDRGAYETADSTPTEPDCNDNGVQDSCDIDALVSTDCNFNRVPDDCDIAGGFSADTDINGVPDECQGVPTNNTCSTAKLVQAGSSIVTNMFATTDGPAEPAGCGFDDGQIHNDVWYRFVAQCGGIVTVNLCGVNFDARMAVYVGCPSQPGQMIACNDNDCGSAPRVSFLAPTSLVYRIRIGGAPGSAGIGGGTMIITCTPTAQCPGDANGDGNVNIADLLLVISNWGQSGLNPADVNGDSVVNVADLLGVIAAWGPCL